MSDKKRISSRDQFELCYLRHGYLRKVNNQPTKEEMEPYYPVVVNISNSYFYANKQLLTFAGFGVEDIININKTHLVSFLGLFSIENNPKKMDSFEEAHMIEFGKNPTKSDVLDKNLASLTSFLKQRMEDMLRICKQKVRNIKGSKMGEVFFVGVTPPDDIRELLTKNQKYGFKKIDKNSFRTARKKAKVTSNISSFQLDGKLYVKIPLTSVNLTIEDFVNSDTNPYNCSHNKTPEELYFDAEETFTMETKRLEFNSYSEVKRRKVLKNFIDKNKKDDSLQEEVMFAIKLLKEGKREI